MRNDLDKLIWEQFYVRIFDESIPRIKNCLDILDQNQIWENPASNLNSIGNLILHLEGNSRQWILATLFGEKDTRKRLVEFESKPNFTADDLKRKLDLLETDLRTKIEGQKVDLSEIYHPQVFTENGVSIVIHVIEHFSYHTGQIALITKLRTGQDLKFYGDQNLEIN